MRLLAPAQSMDHLTPPETRTRSVRRKQRNDLGENSVTLMDKNLVSDSESEEELCYFYPDRVEQQPKHMSGVQFRPSGEKEDTYSDNHLNGTSVTDTVPLLLEEVLEESYPVEAGDSDLEGGDSHRECAQMDTVEPAPVRPKREVRPVVKLSYDKLGQPTSHPLTSVRRGMVISGENSVELRKESCSTVWCHPLAQCPQCALLNSSLVPRVIVPV